MKHNKLDNQNTTETDLLKIIQRQLPPKEQKRLDYLLEKNQCEELSESEQKELKAYADQIEFQGGDKIEALVKLAQLRGVEPKILLDEFFPEK